MNERRLRQRRYRSLGSVLVRNGFDGLIYELGLAQLFGRFPGQVWRPDAALESRPARVRKTLEDLGTTFVKLGQILSTRPDILPPEYVVELSKLQDSVPPIPYETVEAIILEEFGGLPNEVFMQFDPCPRAAGSIGQVHNARLKDGSSVVVKVRRPNIERRVEEDLAVLAELARLVSANSRFGKLYDLEGWVEEFGLTLRNELDYSREGHNADRIRTSFQKDPVVKVPKVYWKFTTPRVLTMEEITGIKIDNLAALDDAGIDRTVLAERCAHIAVVQIFEHGLFHADPHPGNFFVLPDGVVGLIDYGMVGRLDDPLRDSLVRLSLAAVRQDADRFIDEMLSMGMASGPIRRLALKRDLRSLQQKYEGLAIGAVSVSKVFNDVMSTALRHGLRIPSDLMLLFRVVAMDEGLGAHLDPDFNLVKFAQPYLTRFWAKSYSPSAIKEKVKENAVDVGDFLFDLPQRFRHVIGQIERGEMVHTSKIELPDRVLIAFQQAANRIAISVLASGLIVGLSFLTLSHRTGSESNFLNFVLETLLTVALGCGLWLMYAIWRSGR